MKRRENLCDALNSSIVAVFKVPQSLLGLQNLTTSCLTPYCPAVSHTPYGPLLRLAPLSSYVEPSASSSMRVIICLIPCEAGLLEAASASANSIGKSLGVNKKITNKQINKAVDSVTHCKQRKNWISKYALRVNKEMNTALSTSNWCKQRKT